MRRALLVLLAALSVAACGEEPGPKRHGLTVGEAPSDPSGSAIEVQYDFEPDETWTAELVFDADVRIRAGDKPESHKAGRTTFAFLQRHLGGEPPKSETELSYVKVEDTDGTTVAHPEGVTRSTFRHDPSGRPLPGTLDVAGTNIAESNTLFRSLLLAGLGGTESWLPPRPVRDGESWQATEAIDARLVRTLAAQGLRPGVRQPPATLSGSITLERVERTPTGTLLHLRADMLIEMQGETWDEDLRGEISMGYRVQGTATVDARTGIPVKIDTQVTAENNAVSRGLSYLQRQVLSLRGTARRKTR